MELRNTWFEKRSDRVYIAIVAVLHLVIAYFNPIAAGLCAIPVFGVYLVTKKREREQAAELTEYLDSVSASVTEASLYATKNLPIGIAIIDEKSQLVWGNSVFRDWVQDIEDGERLQRLLPHTQLAKLWGKSGYFSTRIEERYYRVIYKFLDMEHAGETAQQYMLLYFDDITEAERSVQESEQALPVFCYLQLDNFTEIASDLTEVQRSALWSEVNTQVLDEFGRLDGFIKNYDRNNYIACISRKSLQQLIEAKFDILDKVRLIHTLNKIPVTLSIGCATGDEGFAAQAEQARLSLDLALGRGGDQAVVRIGEETQTFGGKSTALAKNTRVRARVVAQAIYELIGKADQVLVMGHSHEDYDALGAAIGVAYMATSVGVPARVVVSAQQENVEKMITLVEETEGMADLITDGETAARDITSRTVLFIVDTHRPELTAAPELIEKVGSRVVIDHHRRSNDFIPNPLLTYLEPSSSSASELVTELLQYYSESVDLNETQASALYAGIVVDTKNFAVQTGVRTFDAASYLRRSGANTDLVRDLFMLDFETLQLRSDVLARSERIEGGIACATIPDDADNAQILAGQIADILLIVEGIHATFTIYYSDGDYRVSARSDGSVNVQVVMETLGGGGHQTMAGGRFPDMTPREIRDRLVEAIHTYQKENTK